MASYGHPSLADECAGCGAVIEGGDYAVRNGEPYCNDCVPEKLTGQRFDVDHSDARPESIEEYEASKLPRMHVGVLMDGGQVR